MTMPPQPSAVQKQQAATAPATITGPFVGRWKTEGVFIYDINTGKFNPSIFGFGPYFEITPDGRWCQASPGNLKGCLEFEIYQVSGDTITVEQKDSAATPARYRWRMANQYLVLTLETQQNGNKWIPLVLWALSAASP